MDIDLKVWLYNIFNAIHEIEAFLRDTTEFTVYQNDLKTKRAVERNLEIIGEAMSRILNKETSFQLSNARKIVDTRNRIIHGYDTVSDEVIWGIIATYLPILKQEVSNFWVNSTAGNKVFIQWWLTCMLPAFNFQISFMPSKLTEHRMPPLHKYPFRCAIWYSHIQLHRTLITGISIPYNLLIFMEMI